MSGGRFEDIVHRQLPAMRGAGLDPDIMTAVIGSNDVIWRRDTEGIIADARLVVDALPSDALLSRVSEARHDRRRRGVNEVFEDAQQRGAVTLFEAWDWPTGVGVWAEDNFHPNDAAYRYIADNVWQAMRNRLDGTRRR
jgi:lysophospholipase L1-like esterase